MPTIVAAAVAFVLETAGVLAPAIGTVAQQWPLAGMIVHGGVVGPALAIGSRPPGPVRAAGSVRGT